MSAPLRITGVQIRGFKRIKAIALAFDADDNLITIGGENDNGKSSVLEAIQLAIDPSKARNAAKFIHNGMKGFGVRVNMPPYTITRSHTDAGPTLKVTLDVDGRVMDVPKPAEFVAELLGSGSDPVKFLTDEPRVQRATLAEIVGLDTGELDAAIASAEATFKAIAAKQKDLEARANALPWYEGVPEAPVQSVDIAARIQDAEKLNAEIALAEQASESLSIGVRDERIRLQGAINRVSELEEELARAKSNVLALEKSVAKFESDAADALKRVTALYETRVDIAPLRSELAAADETNRKIRENQLKLAAVAEWKELEPKLGAAKSELDAAKQAKKDALANCEFPVPGLGFDETGVTLNGVPFNMESHANQVKAAIAISLARAGRCPAIFIKDASTVDKKKLRLIAEEAARQGAQVFAEVIANFDDDQYDRTCTIYLNDSQQVDFNGKPIGAVDQPELGVN